MEEQQEEHSFLLRVDLMDHQQQAVKWMQEKRSGILADAMGLGKTLTVLGLLSASSFDQALIVCPLSLLDQWRSEITEKTNLRQCDVLVWRNRTGRTDWRRQRIVLCTYDSLVHCNAQSLLYTNHWNYVFLDEAHRIRSRTGSAFKAAQCVKAPHRWCITATPLNNSLDDLLSLCKFIDVAPYNTDEFWNKVRNEPNLLLAWRKDMLLMRDQRLLSLPSKGHIVLSVTFGEDERLLYSELFAEALHRFTSGARTSALLPCIMQLRQLCNHPLLLCGRIVTTLFAEQSLWKRTAGARCYKCKSCIGLFDMQCGHQTCVTCAATECKMCRRTRRWRPSENLTKSSKFAVLFEYLAKLGEQDKVIIFSQWTCALDLLEYFLLERGAQFFRFDGDLCSEDRRRALKEFEAAEGHAILLASLQCGGVGLNITCANIVILLDAWYNPFVEEQAIHRIYRIGQTRDVTIVRLHVYDSIEDDMVRIKEAKRQCAEHALSKDTGRLEATLTETENSKAAEWRKTCHVFTRKEMHSIFRQSTPLRCRITMLTDEVTRGTKRTAEDSPLPLRKKQCTLEKA